MPAHLRLVVATIGLFIRDSLAGVLDDTLALANLAIGEGAASLDLRSRECRRSASACSRALRWAEARARRQRARRDAFHAGDASRQDAWRSRSSSRAFVFDSSLLASLRRSHDRCPALAESDASRTLALAEATNGHFVSILEKFSLRRSGIATGSVPRHVRSSMQPRSLLSGPETVPLAMQIARPQIAAVARVMRDHLRDCPVHVPERRRGSRAPARAIARAFRRAEIHLERDVVTTACLIRLVVQIRKRRRIALQHARMQASETARAPQASR